MQPSLMPVRAARLGVCAILFLIAPSAQADQQPISVDALYADWDAVPPAHSDPLGDGTTIDFGRLWLADDDRFLFLRFETTIETDPSENQDLVLYLDTDANSGTGFSFAGIGAELVWRFGQRSGTFYANGQSATVYQDNLRFRGAPTVTSTQFEFAIGKAVLPDGQNPLFSGNTIRLALHSATSGDQLPNTGQLVEYALNTGTLPPETVIPLERARPTDVRIITYNVLFDSPFGTDGPRFGRQLAAVDPDILCFQEIYDHSAAQTAALVESWLPSGPGESWYAADNSDCQIVSRYEILASWALNGNLAALLDTTPALGVELLLFSAHPPCCDNDSGRQNEIDNIMSFIREAQQPGGTLELETGAAIHIAGDMNLVGYAQQLTTLLTGDIVNESTYGPDFAPDWDGTPLTNLISRQTELRMGYTWRSDGSSFWPGHLDYHIYADSVLDVGNHFILYTPEMSPANRAAFGLQEWDSAASDHLLFCADFRPAARSGDFDQDGDVDLADLQRLLAAYGKCSGDAGFDSAVDIDQSGCVDLSDLQFLLGEYGQ